MNHGEAYFLGAITEERHLKTLTPTTSHNYTLQEVVEMSLGCMQTAVECMRVAVVWAAQISREKQIVQGAAGMLKAFMIVHEI